MDFTGKQLLEKMTTEGLEWTIEFLTQEIACSEEAFEKLGEIGAYSARSRLDAYIFSVECALCDVEKELERRKKKE